MGTFEEQLKSIGESRESLRKEQGAAQARIKADIKDTREQEENRWKKFNDSTEKARLLSRTTIYRLVLLSSSIIGFSVTVLSIDTFNSSLNTDILKSSWNLLLSAIVIGVLTDLVEGRIEQAVTWKNFQPSISPNIYDYSVKEKLAAMFLVVASIINPNNLIYNGIYKDEKEKTFKERVNGLVVHWLARARQLILLLELAVVALFVVGLYKLLQSFEF